MSLRSMPSLTFLDIGRVVLHKHPRTLVQMVANSEVVCASRSTRFRPVRENSCQQKLLSRSAAGRHYSRRRVLRLNGAHIKERRKQKISGSWPFAVRLSPRTGLFILCPPKSLTIIRLFSSSWPRPWLTQRSVSASKPCRPIGAKSGGTLARPRPERRATSLELAP